MWFSDDAALTHVGPSKSYLSEAIQGDLNKLRFWFD